MANVHREAHDLLRNVESFPSMTEYKNSDMCFMMWYYPGIGDRTSWAVFARSGGKYNLRTVEWRRLEAEVRSASPQMYGSDLEVTAGSVKKVTRLLKKMNINFEGRNDVTLDGFEVGLKFDGKELVHHNNEDLRNKIQEMLSILNNDK